MSDTPTPWALERAEAYLASRDGRPLGDRAGIALALDAARLDGVRAGLARAVEECIDVGAAWGTDGHADGEESAGQCADVIRAIDPADVVVTP